jgi:hypothetical protein
LLPSKFTILSGLIKAVFFRKSKNLFKPFPFENKKKYNSLQSKNPLKSFPFENKKYYSFTLNITYILFHHCGDRKTTYTVLYQVSVCRIPTQNGPLLVLHETGDDKNYRSRSKRGLLELKMAQLFSVRDGPKF